LDQIHFSAPSFPKSADFSHHLLSNSVVTGIYIYIYI
jgi:hypothetical protein